MAINWESNKHYKAQNSQKRNKSAWEKFIDWIKNLFS
jgi:hypothetical protein